MKTRSQQDLEQALELVGGVATENDAEKKKAYGRICHSFPVMVRTCGLCQAVAFSAAKAADGQGGALRYGHEKLLEHVARVLGLPADGLASGIAGANVAEYMLYTRTILRVWVFYKRLAVSMLNVTGANDAGGKP
jgi:CRISPR-associated protein Cmr5